MPREPAWRTSPNGVGPSFLVVRGVSSSGRSFRRVALNVAGAHLGAGLLRWMTLLKVSLLALIVCWGFASGRGDELKRCLVRATIECIEAIREIAPQTRISLIDPIINIVGRRCHAKNCREAEAYRQQAIAEATGEAKEFLSVDEEYKKAPEVTRKRLYLETMQQVLAANQKVLAGRNNNILYLPLNGAQAPANAAPPVTQLPGVKSSPPAAGDERPDRGVGREGGR